MATINGIDMPDFTHGEFSEDPIFASPKLLYSLQEYRTAYGSGIIPSKEPGALARLDGRPTSMHHYDPDSEFYAKQYSNAIDFFPAGSIHKAWGVGVSSGYFNRLGIYFDTRNNKGEPAVMMHGDLKDERLFWFRDNGDYKYSPEKGFWDDLTKLIVLFGL